MKLLLILAYATNVNLLSADTPSPPPTMDSQAASTMSDFSESDRKELQHFMENEQQKAKFQTSTPSLSEKK